MGYYSFETNSGIYRYCFRYVNGSNQLTGVTQHLVSCDIFLDNPTPLTQDTVFDFPVPLKRISVHVQTDTGVPKRGRFTGSGSPGTCQIGALPASHYSWDMTGAWITTDDNGDRSFWLLPATYHKTLSLIESGDTFPVTLDVTTDATFHGNRI
jgi:hypothetical protein